MPPLEGIAAKIQEAEVFGIPLGEAALGGGSALLVAEMTDVFLAPRMPTIPAALIKGGEAYAMSRWGHKVVGIGGARLGTLFLTWEAIRAAIPLEEWVKNAIGKAAAAAGGGGGGGSSGSESSPGGNGHHTTDAMDTLRAAVIAGGRA